MILVDTSVFIDFLRGIENESVAMLDKIIENRLSFGINNFIYQELLQGTKDEKEFSQLKLYLTSLPFFDLKNGKESFEQAALINFRCRRAGITIRSTIDLIIAQTAIENQLYLLHKDADFTNIAKICPELKTELPWV